VTVFVAETLSMIQRSDQTVAFFSEKGRSSTCPQNAQPLIWPERSFAEQKTTVPGL